MNRSIYKHSLSQTHKSKFRRTKHSFVETDAQTFITAHANTQTKMLQTPEGKIRRSRRISQNKSAYITTTSMNKRPSTSFTTPYHRSRAQTIHNLSHTASGASVEYDSKLKSILVDPPRQHNISRNRHSAALFEKSQQQQAIEDALGEIERQKVYHKRFIELMTRKFIDRYPQNKPKLRELCKVQKFYTEIAQQSQDAMPQYFQYSSSFYSRSRQRCFKEVEDNRNNRQDEYEPPERKQFTYFDYVADIEAKKSFEGTAKSKTNLKGIGLLKSKEKILSLWKHGTKQQEDAKALIEYILRGKKLA